MSTRIAAWKRVRMLATVALLGVAAAGGCSGSGVGGGGDQSASDTIRIDEASIAGTAVDGKIAVDVPVEALRNAHGTLSVSIRGVDGATTFATAKAGYDVPAGQTAHVAASLDMPTGVTSQADWVRLNLRVEDGSGVRLTTSMLRVMSPYELKVDGPKNLAAGKTVSYRLHAQNPITLAPRAAESVALQLKQGDEVVATGSGTTDALGDAVIAIDVPQAGSYTVVAQMQAQGTATSLESAVTVAAPGRKVLLTTDKPIYQPGQTIHLRALALAPPQNTPLAAKTVTFEIEDGKGNKILKRDLTTDGYGIAATRFTLGSILNTGSCKVRAIVDGTATEKTVTVSSYALPKFNIGVSMDRSWYGPGDTLLGNLNVGYFFGKPVSGASVTIEGVTYDVGETVFQRVVGQTDGTGKMSFSLQLPSSLVGLPLDQGNALVNLRATVTDTAGQVVTKETAVTVAEGALRVVLVPEATSLVPGVENRLQLFVSDPLGVPVAGAAARVAASTQWLDTVTDAFGYAEVLWTPASSTGATLQVRVTPPGGAAVIKNFTFTGQAGAEHVLVRTDKAVYDVGESVQVQILVTQPEAHVYVDWINEGQTVDMRTLEPVDGVAAFTMPLDATLLGTNRVEGYVVDPDGNIIRAGRTIFARQSTSLAVSVAADKAQYRPGDAARLTFSVADESGQPAVAALGVQIVDQAVFALIDSKPGLLSTYFELEDAYAEPQYEIQAPAGSLADLLFEQTRSSDPAEAAAAQGKAQASFAALGGGSFTGLQLASWSTVVQAAVQLMQPYYTAEKKRLIAVLRPIAQREAQLLALQGCTAYQYYCPSLNMEFGEALAQRLKGHFAAWDFWGNRYAVTWDYWMVRLHSAGPDERSNTTDDADLSISFSELGIDQYGGGEYAGSADGGHMQGDAGAWEPPTGGGGDTGGGTSSGPRVRKDFPETLYVNPEIITDADGQATIDLNVADSITEWRISTLAHSADGRLGGSQSGIRVFQDFFTDISFPATLTRGDEVQFPIAVYNYLATPQTVSIVLTPGTWYTPLGTTTETVDVGAGAVVGVRFPVRVEEVGLQTLTVTATGSSAADALARTVLVVPDGKAFPAAVSGALPAGSVQHDVSFPANAVLGSPELYLQVYPAYLSQVVTGMDSMLQVPNGCFEQTTSTTWPNVLVTRYMTQTGQITSAIQMKAESLISAGYQRLLTFEHQGGGFSWFGEQDPKPFLSVTAFGVMEFADMAKVQTVDPAMLQRTIAWLVAQQQADGSWAGDVSEFFSFQTSVLRNTAFVVWALAEADYTGAEVQRGLTYVKSKLGTDEDPYTLGIIANAFARAAPADTALATVLADLDGKKQVDGDKVYWDSEGTQTNFYSGGQDAQVIATALVARAMLVAGGHASDVEGALSFLSGSKDANGNFGSTQATIWALRALLLAAEKGTDGAVGSLQVDVDGAPFTTLSLTADQGDVMTTVNLKPYATVGAHHVALSFVGTGKVSYNLVARHNLAWAEVPAEPAGPLSITITYDKTTLAVDDTVKATVHVVNNTASVQSMVIVTLGIPPGFAVLTEDLDAYKTSGQLSTYDLTGKQLILYVSALAPSSTTTFQYRLQASMPVKASDGGGGAYLYYQPDVKTTAPSTILQAD
jgi:alpha-2-macroglobulin-like protein